MDVATRIKDLPPYLFAQIEQKVAEAKKRGVEVLDLGIGDPDLPTPQFIIDRLCQEAQRAENHRYPSYRGLAAFREAVAQWYHSRFGVELDSEREVVSLIGSKEGIAHLPWCLVNPGDIVLASDPGYPVYKIGAMLAGGNPLELPLYPQNNFLPDFSIFPDSVWKKTRLVFLNYPNNPTSAVATLDFFREAVELAHRYQFVIAHDLAYSEISFDGYHPPSIFQVEGAKEVAVEFHSLSKTFNMTGWRIGFAVGNDKVIEALGRVKTNIDSGIFNAIQWAGVEALSRYQEVLDWILPIYTRRRNLLVETFRSLGFDIDYPQATFYLWIPTPQERGSMEFASYLLDKTGVVVTPGQGFGKYGEGFFRISLTTPDEVLQKAAERIRKLGG
ncbi:MAG: LL-diaminopimelate aminotransferase [Candidatus Atribacteria bacterium]|nr:LL-diaminopimelate aminotransferase [Candidatus Atribacteria bacterium]